jgi:hydroxymethylglutaryl-CoA synthase
MSSQMVVTQVPVGIVGHGAYVPRQRLDAQKAAEQRVHSVPTKSVCGSDEDTITMSIEAGQNSLLRAQVSAYKLRAIWLGSQSNPYDVKPSATVVAEALGAGPHLLAADMAFACKSGSEALQACFGLIGSGIANYALAIGMDAISSKPEDECENIDGAGGAAFVVGPGEKSEAVLEGSLSYTTDMPADATYPEQNRRFSGYVEHIIAVAAQLMEELKIEPSEIAHAVFHQPTVKSVRQVATSLSFTARQVKAGLMANQIGNAYAGSMLLGLCAVLDVARPGEKVLCVSYGGCAGSDAFLFRTTECLREAQARSVPRCADYVQSARVPSHGAVCHGLKSIGD